MDYGRAVRVARAARNMSQKELALNAGVKPSFISLIESGRRNPSTSTVLRLSSALEIPVPLLTLLASSSNDLKSIDDQTAGALATKLLQILVEAREEFES